MKMAQVFAERLAKFGVKHVFCVSGGASLHLIHGIADTPGIELVCPIHEQACGFAADAYARLTGFGVALATSGPGATNLITAIATSYYDSIPVLYVTGQVASFRMTGDSGCRQIGFQETPIVDMVSKITKYSVTLQKPEDIVNELDTCILRAFEGRKGPVLLDIPDDFQRADI